MKISNGVKSQKKKIAIIVGARPNFVKIAPLIDILNKKKPFDYLLVHTGQHYDFEMSQIFFRELNIPKPNINLGIRSDIYPFTTQIALIKKKLQTIFKKEKPDLCLVVGDCNSAIGGALAAKNLSIPAGHIEAGLRSFDRTMSEESNRLITDLLSDYLFTHSRDANQNLLNEGHNPKKIFFVGNIMIDALIQNQRKILNYQILKRLNLKKKQYGVLTLHRYNSIDVKPVLNEILAALFTIREKLPIIAPLHPSTVKKINEFFPRFNKKIAGMKNLRIISPIGYLDMITLLKNARLVFTDSGGIQEETTFLGIPCLTLRNNTERPITISMGTNTIAGVSKSSILYHFKKIMQDSFKARHQIPPKWDGNTSQRILKIISAKL